MSARRPLHPVLRASLVGIAYFIAASTMILLTRFDAGVASLWVATALLVAELSIRPRQHWLITIAACGIGSCMATGLVGFGWAAAGPLMLFNMFEAIVGAVLLCWLGHCETYLDTLEGVAVFALATCCVATAVTAITAGLMLSAVTGMSPIAEASAWFAGHALGTLTFAPIFTLLLKGEIFGVARRSTRRGAIEAGGLLTLMVLVAIAVFSNDHLPLLFVPMLPLMIVAFRLERSGVAIAIVILAGIGGLQTLAGHGPMRLIDGPPIVHAQMFQAYLAVTLLTVLPVTAELQQRKDIFRRLVDSELRYKLITEAATDMILTLDMAGIIRYASPSVREITGFDPGDLIGRQPQDLIGDQESAKWIAAYRHAIDQPEIPSSIEYQAAIANGEMRWFEANFRGVFADGKPTGWVSAIRDVSHRKSLELRLAHAATTDSLTGLANRRAFDVMLDRQIRDQRAGSDTSCVAIFDIDFFKRVNDAHGHAVGDLVLETFAAAATRVLRVGDHVARLGGEEFGLILNGADLDAASHICDRLRMAIARDITKAPGGIAVSITVSAGIAPIDGSKTALQIMRQADDALYRAKAGGRDQLAVAA